MINERMRYSELIEAKIPATENFIRAFHNTELVESNTFRLQCESKVYLSKLIN